MAEFDTLTALGDIPGTLAYISPERLQGLTATSAADVWGVGVLLWEALAGEHPFWGGDMVETSRRIQQGAPGLETLRPDLPDHVLETVASALLVNPQRRPTADRLAAQLRNLPKRKKKKGGSRSGGPKAIAAARTDPAVLGARLLPGALSGLASGWVAARLPFYPAGWALPIAAVGASLGFTAPRLGLIFALTIGFFPLANISLGLAALYGACAAGWVALTWKDARAGLLLAAGPLLAPMTALAFLPLVGQLARGRMRRALHAFAAVLLAALIAGLRKVPLPFDGSAPPLGLGITGSVRPTAVAHALWAQLAAHPVLLGEAVVLAAAAALLPYARNRGPWPAAGFGAALLAGTALTAPAAAVLPLIAAAWLTAGTLALQAKS
jgi:hypothetical protein